MSLIVAQSEIQAVYQLSPLFGISVGWRLLAIGAVVAGVIGASVWLSRRDTGDAPRSLRWLLSALRIAACLWLLVFVLNPQRRAESRFVKPSRLLMLVDTSLSMGLSAPVSTGGEPKTRIDEAIDWLNDSGEINELRRRHELAVYQFGADDQPQPIALLKKFVVPGTVQTGRTYAESARSVLHVSRQLARIGLVLLAAAVILGLSTLTLPNESSTPVQTWRWSMANASLLTGVVVIGLAAVLSCDFDLGTILSTVQPDDAAFVPDVPLGLPSDAGDAMSEEPSALPRLDRVTWAEVLQPTGASTRVGSAINALIRANRGGPVAGILILTDGRSNAGLDPEIATVAAADAGISIFPIGLGDRATRRSIQILDVECPPRVFPGDRFTLRVLATGTGVSQADVELYSTDENQSQLEVLEGRKRVAFGTDTKPAAIDFQLKQAATANAYTGCGCTPATRKLRCLAAIGRSVWKRLSERLMS